VWCAQADGPVDDGLAVFEKLHSPEHFLAGLDRFFNRLVDGGCVEAVKDCRGGVTSRAGGGRCEFIKDQVYRIIAVKIEPERPSEMIADCGGGGDNI